MKRLLFVLSAWLALPFSAWATSNDSCTILPPAGVIDSGAIICRTICDITAAGAFTCGPFWVPGGGRNIDLAIIRAIQGTSTSGCGYDDVNVYTLSSTNTAAGTELPSIGILDDDGSASGSVKQIEHFGPLGPYIYLAGTAGTGGTCNAGSRLQIQLLIYHTQAN